MFYPARLLLLWMAIASMLLRAETSLESAVRAQALLGPEIWSRIIAIHNETRGGVYPRDLHALVFELAGILWFYTDVNGTQSFSLHRGKLAEEKGDFGPLLRDIEGGFADWSIVEKPDPVPARTAATLRNGCFIESVAALRERVARGLRTENPRLLSYYCETPGGQKGHTVLAYRSSGVVEVFDPDRPGQNLVFAPPVDADALTLARALDGDDVRKARYVPIGVEGAGSNVVAANARSRTPVSGAGRKSDG